VILIAVAYVALSMFKIVLNKDEQRELAYERLKIRREHPN